MHVCRHLGEVFGAEMKYIWAIGLFAAGQSSTTTGTYTGQFVMSGFLDLHVCPWVRACITRSVALLPTLAFAVAYAGTTQMDVINQLLNVLQSVQLPFALIPVLYMSMRADVMGSHFLLKWWVRIPIQIVCGLLLTLNLSLVAFYLTRITPELLIGSGVALVCACYSAFVVYLLIGPARLHDVLSGHENLVSRALCRWFGQARGDCVGGMGALDEPLLPEDSAEDKEGGEWRCRGIPAWAPATPRASEE